MSLEELGKKLYSEKGNLPKDSGPGGKDDSQSGEHLLFEPSFFEVKKENKEDIWIKEDEEKKEKRKKIKKIALIAAASLALLLGLIWAVIAIRKSAFTEEKVAIALSGPEQLRSGDLAYFEIDYQNLNRTGLRDAVVFVNVPDNFKLENTLEFEARGPNSWSRAVGTVAKSSGGKIPVRGRFFGPKNLRTYVTATLEYSSFDFSSRFKAESQASVFITSSPLDLEIIGPQEVSSEGTVSLEIKYANNGGSVLRNLAVRAEYPSGFSYKTSEPLPLEKNNSWYVGDLSPGQSGKIVFSGAASGGDGELKRFRALAGENTSSGFVEYSSSETNVKITGPLLVIEQAVNGSKGPLVVASGDILNFSVKFRNTGNVGLRDVVLTEEIASPMLDFSRVGMLGAQGYVDAAKGAIIWNAATVPELKVLNPGAGGEVLFSIPVKEIIPVNSFRDKNFSVNAEAKLASMDIPSPEPANKVVSSEPLVIKLKSKLGLAVEAYYNDPEIMNSGPIPFQVGKETTLAVHIKLTNVSNDLTGARVATTLAPGVTWKNIYFPKNEKISAGKHSGEVVWNVGDMPAGIGVLTGPREVVFQLGLVPGQNLVGSYMPILGPTVFGATDTFTGQKLEAKLEGKDSNLQEDMSVGDAGKVIQ